MIFKIATCTCKLLDPKIESHLPMITSLGTLLKGRFQVRIMKPPVSFPTPIKWKEYQLDPLGAASAASLWGIKHRGVFKKATYIGGF